MDAGRDELLTIFFAPSISHLPTPQPHKLITMGTGSLKIVRYCGKYYLYYTGVDGNPEIIGSDIVELIRLREIAPHKYVHPVYDS
jgi:hypothetical protein